MTGTIEPFTRLLLPVETVETFELVIPLACRFIRFLDIPVQQVDLLHVVAGAYLRERFSRTGLAAEQVVPEKDLQRLRADYLADTAVPLLESCCSQLERNAGCGPFNRLIGDGDPVAVISSLCLEKQYSTLIMGRRRLLPGMVRRNDSVTVGLLHHHAGTTVYLTGDEPQVAPSAPFARCLIGIDGSDASRNAVREAGLLLSRVNAGIERVVLVHVLDQSCYYHEDGVPCSTFSLVGQHALEEASTALINAGVDQGVITTVIHFGSPGAVLVQEAIDYDATMIFIGKRDRSRMAQLYLGSVCTEILENCRQRILALVA